MASLNSTIIGPSGNTKPIPIWHSIPPTSASDYEFKIETDSDTVSLKDLVMKATVVDGVTTTIGSFEIEIIDPSKTIYNQIETFDKLKWYADYGTPETLRFTGYIERVGYQDIYTVISGRSLGMIFSNKNVIYDSDGYKNRDEILKELLEANFSSYNINTDNIVEDETQLDVNYYEVPMIDIIEEICGSSHDFYLDHSFNAHYFVKGDRQNATDGINQEQNHVETSDNADDTESTYTKVRTYGASVGDIPLIYTSESDTSNTKGVEKIYNVTDTSITTTDQAASYTNLQYDALNQVFSVGTHTSLLLPTLQPGEKLFMAIPRENIDPGYYTISSYTHEIDLTADYDRKTTVNVTKRREQISDIIKNRIKTETKLSDNDNPNDLDYSLIVQFDDDTGTHSDTEINEGYLKLSAGFTQGTWISDIYTLDDDISELEFKWSGENLVGDYQVTSSQLWYSLDAGTVWSIAVVGETSLSGEISSNRDLRFKVEFKKADAKLEGIGLLYSY